MTKAFSYIRMSTETQLKGHSLARQLAITREYAAEKGLDLVEDLQDIGLSAHSGKNVEKGKLGDFIKAVEAGLIPAGSVLIVESLDRLSRQSPMLAFQQFSGFLEHGIEIHTVFDRQVYSADSVKRNAGQLFLSIGYMVRAFNESDEKSKRLKKKWADKREKIDSRIYTTRCPAWLIAKADKTGFEIRHHSATTVSKIFELLIDGGMGAYSITRYLNENLDQFPPIFSPSPSRRRSGQGGWQKSYVMKILHNPAVHGEFQPHQMVNGKRVPSGETLTDYFPAVIAKDRYLLAQVKLKDRGSLGGGRAGAAFRNVFTKMTFCGNCGSTVHFIDKGKPPKGGQYLQCYNSLRRHKECPSPAWNYTDFETSFFQFVTDIDLPSLVGGHGEKSRRIQLAEEVRVSGEKIEILNRKIDRLLDIDDGEEEAVMEVVMAKVRRLTASVGQQAKIKSELETELTALEDRAARISNSTLVNLVKDSFGVTEPLERAAVRRRINAQLLVLIEKVEIYNHFPAAIPPEYATWLSKPGRAKLVAMGYDTSEKFLSYFNGAAGHKRFENAERHFRVQFRNGQTRTVYPFIDKSWLLDERQFSAFRIKASQAAETSFDPSKIEKRYQRRSKSK